MSPAAGPIPYGPTPPAEEPERRMGIPGGPGVAARRRAPPRARDDRDADPDREEGVAVRERPQTRRPSLYRVLLHNDDYTTMEFVVDALVRYFEKTATEAMRIMLQVHHLGVGVAGTYTRDEAETRIERVTTAAQAEGYPLMLTMEPE